MNASSNSAIFIQLLLCVVLLSAGNVRGQENATTSLASLCDSGDLQFGPYGYTATSYWDDSTGCFKPASKNEFPLALGGTWGTEIKPIGFPINTLKNQYSYNGANVVTCQHGSYSGPDMSSTSIALGDYVKTVLIDYTPGSAVYLMQFATACGKNITCNIIHSL